MTSSNSKDVKGEKLDATLDDYIKRRNYDVFVAEAMPVAGASLSTEEKLCLQNLVSPSSPNCYTLSTTNSHYAFIEQQYIRLKAWMTEASDPCRTELSQVLFPIFIYLYLELLTGPGKNTSKNFFTRHHQVFRVNREYEQTLRQVCSVSWETANCPLIQTFRSGKYCVRLSELTFNYFLRYLQTSGNPTLLQIFNNYIEVDVSDDIRSNSLTPTFRFGAGDDGFVPRSRSISQETDDMDCTNKEVEQVKDVISRVQSIKPSMPSMCVYSVINAYNGLSAAVVNGDSTQLACGFEDSVIKCWRLTPPTQNIGLDPIAKTPNEKTPESLLFCDTFYPAEDGLPKRKTYEEEECKNSLGGRHIAGGESHTLRGHYGPVFDMAFSNVSAHLFSVGEDTNIRLWDLDEQRTVVLYKGHHQPIFCIEVSAQSVFVATGSYDTTCRLWTPERTYPIRTMAGHESSVNCVAFHPNCNYIASGSSDRSIRMWQIGNAEVARVLLHHKTPVRKLKFSPDGRYLASGTGNGEVAIWDLNAGEVVSSLKPPTSGDQETPFPSQHHLDAIVSLDWSKDSRMLISASAEGYVRANYFQKGEAELGEVGSVLCGSSQGSGITLIDVSLNKQNYLSAVMAVHGER